MEEQIATFIFLKSSKKLLSAIIEIMLDGENVLKLSISL